MTWLKQGAASPQPDGVETSFATPSPYEEGSLRVYINGQKLGLDCVFEVDPEAGVFDVPLAEPLNSGWLLEVVYVDPFAPDGIFADQIRVDLEDATISATISSATIRADILGVDDPITAVLEAVTITAELDVDDTLTVELCCL